MDRLVPGTAPPRARVSPAALVTIAAALFAGALAVLVAVGASDRRPAGCWPRSPPAPPVTAPAVAAPPAPPPAMVDEAADAAPVTIAAGSCAGSLIAPLRQPTSAADAAALRLMLGAWLGDTRTPGPGLEHRRGVVHIESEEDRGDDGPYPRSAAPEAERVCGSATGWLRTYLRDALAWRAGELVCDGNVCCYAGMEYAPSGYVVFHHGPGDDAPWTLDAWVEAYTAALGPDDVDANVRFVGRAIRRLAHGHCAGEPRGRID